MKTFINYKTFVVRFFVAALLITSLAACQKAPDLSAVDPRWDVTTCERCKMLLSDKKFSAQVVNPKDGKHYYFDDLGCALVWVREPQQAAWGKDALIYATDAKTGKWLNVKDNEIVAGYVTPMAYGMGVLPKGTPPEEGKKIVTIDQAVQIMDELIQAKKKNPMKPHEH